MSRMVLASVRGPRRELRWQLSGETRRTSFSESTLRGRARKRNGHNVTSAPRTSAADEFLRFRSRVNHTASSRRWDVGACASSVMQDQAEDLVRDDQVAASDRPKDKRLREAVRLVAVRLGGRNGQIVRKRSFEKTVSLRSGRDKGEYPKCTS